eukprot:3928318-Pyramimonas_sp.AAC.1
MADSASPVLAELERDEGHGDNLARVRLGACHADLRARVDVHAAVGAPRDGAAHRVGDAHAEGAVLLRVVQRLRRRQTRPRKPLQEPKKGGKKRRFRGNFRNFPNSLGGRPNSAVVPAVIPVGYRLRRCLYRPSTWVPVRKAPLFFVRCRADKMPLASTWMP